MKSIVVESWRELQHHPISEVFRMMNDRESRDLREDIRLRGYRNDEPVVLYEGSILDGRNRHRECKALDDLGQLPTPPPFVDYDGSDPVGYALSRNKVRRHSSEGELIDAAVKMVPLAREEARKRQAAHWKMGPQPKKADSRCATDETRREQVNKPRRRATDDVATAIGIDRGRIDRALTLKEKAPDLYEKVVNDQMKVKQAYREMKQRLGETPPRKRPGPTFNGQPISKNLVSGDKGERSIDLHLPIAANVEHVARTLYVYFYPEEFDRLIQCCQEEKARGLELVQTQS